jgi:hypothetical protein
MLGYKLGCYFKGQQKQDMRDIYAVLDRSDARACISTVLIFFVALLQFSIMWRDPVDPISISIHVISNLYSYVISKALN